MPQFAVYRNPGRNPDIPFVVQIQGSRLGNVLYVLPERDQDAIIRALDELVIRS